MTLPVGSRACRIFLPYSTRQEILWNVNGQPYIATVPQLETGRPITATARVTTQGAQKQISVLVNEAPYFQWQGSESTLSCTELGKMPRMEQPGLTNDQDQHALHAIQFRLLEGIARLVSRDARPRPYILTGDVGGYQGTVFEDFGPGDGVLVGLRYASAGIGLSGLQPVYRTANGQLYDGARFGGALQRDDSIVAKEGYAVGALAFETQDQLTGVTVRFHRLDNDSLDLNDTYDSPLVGQRGTDGLSLVETRGRPAIGVHGLWTPGRIISLGLASARPAPEKLWRESNDNRRKYLSLLDLEPTQCTVAEMRHSRRLGVGTGDPSYRPIIDEDSQFCDEFLYAPAPSRLIWKLTPATMKSFSALGYCVESRSVRFRVLVDGQTIYESDQAGVSCANSGPEKY